MKPALRHRVCASPGRISAAIGLLVSWTVLTLGLWKNSQVLAFAAGEPFILSGLVLAYLAVGALGALFGYMILFAPMAAVCRRINRAPLQVGDRVLVLGGKFRGRSGEVYALCEGQGGIPLARVDLGDELRQSFEDLFDDFRLLRLSRASP